eukprot:TRINITY_DN7547_c0_g1_i1.p1 TRINITY_DN7547_c0_g1~~TRINITY_DN7547_c0_g1_i1.p1  ORF type:complete len:280 (-),score=67.20 TRINITY_DN7547_c0_g1_i1:305-1144(-)
MKKGNTNAKGRGDFSRRERNSKAQKHALEDKTEDFDWEEESEDPSVQEDHKDFTSGEEIEESDSKEKELEDKLADIPFEKLQKMRSDGREKVFSKAHANFKISRANKNRPMEISSKKPVGCFREVIQAPKMVVRDPRFESLCGEYDQSRFRKRYGFLFDEELPKEREKLQKLLKSSKDAQAVREIEKHISWIDSQLQKAQEIKKQSQKLSEHKKQEKEAIKQGKRPFYLKKSELRKKELAEKYGLLKASGKLESFLAKKRRKNASKDHRYMPYRRTATQ